MKRVSLVLALVLELAAVPALRAQTPVPSQTPPVTRQTGTSGGDPSAPNHRNFEVLEAARMNPNLQPFTRSELGLALPRMPAIQVVRTALTASPQVQTQEQAVQGAAGQVQVAEGVFDTNVVGRVGYDHHVNERDVTNRVIPGASPVPTPYPNPLRQRQGVFEYEAGIRKMLANGIVVNPRVSFRHDSQRDYGSIFNTDNRTTLGFTITIPLAKGGGTLANKAPEIAARFDLTASVLQLRYITSQSVANTLLAYWACKAAEEIYHLRLESESIANRLVGLASALVEGDELAPAQLAQIIADRDSTTAVRIQAESDLIQARQALAVAMGFPPSALLLAPLPKDPFPEPMADARSYPSPQTLIPIALSLRDDLRAARQTVKSRKVLMEASHLNLRPTINLQLTGGYVPFETRNQTQITEGNNWEGGAALSWEWPVENNSATGAYIQSQAAFNSSEIAVVETERTVTSQVVNALAALQSSAANVKLFSSAARWNLEALKAQEELFALGQGSLTDTITTRQRLVESQLAAVRAKQSYAAALVQLRLASGTLFFSNEGGSWIDQNIWNLVPFLGRTRE
jgi:outer membrane protein